MKLKPKYLLLILLIVGAFLRFYNLNWGAPFYFHPDERNIANLLLQSSLTDPESLLTGTFAYGNFPIILALFLKSLFIPIFQIFNINDAFAQSVIVLRAISALFSVLTLYVVYQTGKYLLLFRHPEFISGSKNLPAGKAEIPKQVRNDSEKTGLLALFFATFSVGFIQQAHFGTYDGFATFCAATLFYYLLHFIKTKKITFYYLAIIILSLGAAAKINLLVLALFPGIMLLTRFKKRKKEMFGLFKHAVLGMILLLGLTALLSPNYLTPEFRNSLFYERGLVTGLIPVFYTQSFHTTTPVIFQFLNIYPFLINPLLTIIFIPAFFYLLIKSFKTKNKSFLILTTFYLILFLPQAFLFAKWTRYMVPTLPFVYLIVSVSLVGILSWIDKNKRVVSIKYLVFSIILTSSIIFCLSYFTTAFVKPDTRIEAAEYARQIFPNNSRIITEPYDLGIIPFNSASSNIESFNFYEQELSPISHLSLLISGAKYIILPSQRLIRSRILNAEKFSKGNKFYQNLINGNLGYKKTYETPCDMFCQITYLGDPVFRFEETASVFERPTVMIFKRAR